jgi:SH3-like domain-containing protein
MRRKSVKWIYRSLPVIAAGLVGLMLLPAGQTAITPTNAGTTASMPRPTTDIARFEPVAVVNAPPLPAVVQAKIQMHPGVTTPIAEKIVLPVVATGPSWTDVHVWSRVLTAVSTLPAGTTPADGRIGSSAVFAHAEPSSVGARLFTLSAGEAVKLGATSGGWVEVRRADGSSGWVYSRFLDGPGGPKATGGAPQVRAAAAPTKTRPRYREVRSTVPVLAAPSERAGLLFVLQPGDRVQFAERSGNWVHVVTEYGESGWMPT